MKKERLRTLFIIGASIVFVGLTAAVLNKYGIITIGKHHHHDKAFEAYQDNCASDKGGNDHSGHSH